MGYKWVTALLFSLYATWKLKAHPFVIPSRDSCFLFGLNAIDMKKVALALGRSNEPKSHDTTDGFLFILKLHRTYSTGRTSGSL